MGTQNPFAAAVPAGQEVGLPAWPNQPYLAIFRVVGVAALTPYQLPWVEIPQGMELAIKGYPTNLGLVYVSYSPSAVLNINTAWPLVASEALHLAGINALAYWFCSALIGESIICTVEQRSRSGG